MKRLRAGLLACMLASCGSDVPTGPTSAASGDGPVPPAGLRNRGTQVWLVPAPAGDLMKLAQQPELWPRAQQRIDVVSLYMVHAYHHEGFECGTPCGPNTYPNLRAAVPGGMFRWLSQRYALAFEAGSVKSFSCTDETIRWHAAGVNQAITNIEDAGGTLSYVTLDEPFASGTNDPSTPGFGGCGLHPSDVARLQRTFNDAVAAVHPEVRIGLIEPYPKFGPDQIASFMLELDRAGVGISYFHLDLYLQAAVRERRDVATELRRIREFFHARGVPFGVIVFGEDGSSNEEYSADAWATARLIASTTGVTEHTVFQSWAESEPGNLVSLKDKPDTVPEADPFTHTGLVLRILEFFGVQSAK